MRGIYIHMPFCLRKCRYCDFLSFPDMRFYDDYIKALKNEIKAYKSKESISTIYIGGGTPSIAKESDIADILDVIFNNYYVSDEAEITLEANPKTLSQNKLLTYKKSGINRLSVGLQSANDKELKLLGRIHNYEEFYNNYMLARECGFNNISIDVMSGIPEQTLESYIETLNKVIKLKPEHISSYSLIIEEGTYFYNHLEELKLPNEDTEREMYYKTNELLKSAGYQRYEISNYAKMGYESRHNSSYWKCMEYYGFGLGASSYIDNNRYNNTRDVKTYIDYYCNKKGNIDSIIMDKEIIDTEEKMYEYVILGLRMTKGIKKEDFYGRFNVNIMDKYKEVLEKYIKKGYLKDENGYISFSEKGLDISNYILSEI